MASILRPFGYTRKAIEANLLEEMGMKAVRLNVKVKMTFVL